MKKFLLFLNDKVQKLMPYDKSLHLICGGIVMFITSLILFALKAPFPLAITLSLVVTFFAGLIKERLDTKLKGEGISAGDIGFTCIGGMLMAVVEVVMFYITPHIVVY